MDCDAPLVAPAGLTVAGLCHDGAATIALIAPDGPSFWRIFTESPESADGRADPMDRWSRRVIGGWAMQIGSNAVFPSDGPPNPPFYEWALASGRCWASPGMLVHDVAGLFISFRGALRLPGLRHLRAAGPRPCDGCRQPCRDACPVDAFKSRYTADLWHEFLNREAGRDCMSEGCRARRACPLSIGCGRLPEQSAWHMRQFHP